MIANSATVLANLAYLIGAVVVAVIIGFVVWLRHRQPKSVDANMASFRRGLSALAPDSDGQGFPPRQNDSPRIRAVPAGHQHVRLDHGDRGRDAADGGDDEGGQPG